MIRSACLMKRSAPGSYIGSGADADPYVPGLSGRGGPRVCSRHDGVSFIVTEKHPKMMPAVSSCARYTDWERGAPAKAPLCHVLRIPISRACHVFYKDLSHAVRSLIRSKNMPWHIGASFFSAPIWLFMLQRLSDSSNILLP